MQLIVGTLMLYISMNVQKLMDDVSVIIVVSNIQLTFFEQPANNVTELTVVFTSLVMFSATQGEHHNSRLTLVTDLFSFFQDIAVDGS